ncbi:hypothetical protein PMIN06_010480 [Paraphaeosphaeria minitans]
MRTTSCGPSLGIGGPGKHRHGTTWEFLRTTANTTDIHHQQPSCAGSSDWPPTTTSFRYHTFTFVKLNCSCALSPGRRESGTNLPLQFGSLPNPPCRAKFLNAFAFNPRAEPAEEDISKLFSWDLPDCKSVPDVVSGVQLNRMVITHMAHNSVEETRQWIDPAVTHGRRPVLEWPGSTSPASLKPL